MKKIFEIPIIGIEVTCDGKGKEKRYSVWLEWYFGSRRMGSSPLIHDIRTKREALKLARKCDRELGESLSQIEEQWLRGLLMKRLGGYPFERKEP
jgi:hypothetical protein